MKLDLTIQLPVQTQGRNSEGQMVSVETQASLATIFLTRFEQVPSFEQARLAAPFIELVKDQETAEISEAQFFTFYSIVKGMPASCKNRFAEMVEKENEGFDMVAYEKSHS